MINHWTDLSTDHLKCRAFGHRWEEFIPVGMGKPEFGFRFSLLCTRCGTERHDLIDQLGQVAHRAYHYADEYELGTLEKPTREDIRLHLHERKRSVARRGKLMKER